MPLPWLQSVGASNEPFLYTIGWTADVSRSAVSRYLRDGGGDFDNRIELRPGVAAALVELNGLLRPLIQRSWARDVPFERPRLSRVGQAVQAETRSRAS
jgi:hypothetical protein